MKLEYTALGILIIAFVGMLCFLSHHDGGNAIKKGILTCTRSQKKVLKEFTGDKKYIEFYYKSKIFDCVVDEVL